MNSSLSGILMNSVTSNKSIKIVWQAVIKWFLDKNPNIINVWYMVYLKAYLLDSCLYYLGNTLAN